MQLNNFKRVEVLREIVFSYLKFAQANISGHRVAAAVLAVKKRDQRAKEEQKPRIVMSRSLVVAI